MPVTRIGIEPGSSGDAPDAGTAVRATLVVGALAPRLIRRSADSAHIGITAAEMILLDGDVVDLEVEVGAGCTLVLEDIGGTVAYPQRRSRPSGRPAEWNVAVTVGEGAGLIWKSLPLVVADNADVLRTVRVHLADGARALLRETLVLGRSGESGGRIRSATEVSDPGGPVLAEDLLADGGAPEPGVLGVHRVYDQVSAVGFRPPPEAEHLVLEAPGTIARYLGAETHHSPLEPVFDSWARCMLGDGALKQSEQAEQADGNAPQSAAAEAAPSAISSYTVGSAETSGRTSIG